MNNIYHHLKKKRGEVTLTRWVHGWYLFSRSMDFDVHQYMSAATLDMQNNMQNLHWSVETEIRIRTQP